MILNKKTDISITENTGTIIGTVFMMTVLVVGNQVVSLPNNMVLNQNVIEKDGQTNIYKSNLDNDYIFLDIPGYNFTDHVKAKTDSLVIDEEKMYNLKKLEEIASLQDNWNGNGAKSFSNQLISQVKNLIILLEIQPEVFPTACETIQLEYDKEDGAHLEIEIKEDKSAEIFWIKHTGEEELRNIQANIEMIDKVVKEFYG